MTQTENEKYSGLRWYLPSYFKNSLASCRFEQGTIIYKDKPIGKNWGEQIEHFDFLIQIQFPPSTMSKGGGDESIIAANWNSEVIFDMFYPKTKKNITIKTTQGRLFTFLWKDNIEIFDSKEELLAPLFKITNSNINEKFLSQQISEDSIGFGFIFNPISDILLSKLNSIILNAKDVFELNELTFSIEDACIKLDTTNTSGIYPLLCVKLLVFKTKDINKVSDLIKNSVYKGSMGQFSIKTHGVLIQK